MHILEAMTLRDGGTTCISIEEDGQVKHVTFDHALPMDDRIRYVYVSDTRFGNSKAERLEPNSEEEKGLIAGIHTVAVEELGAEAVEAYLRDPHLRKVDGMWYYMLNFLWIAVKGRVAS
jgi:hypothetical protein